MSTGNGLPVAQPHVSLPPVMSMSPRRGAEALIDSCLLVELIASSFLVAAIP